MKIPCFVIVYHDLAMTSRCLTNLCQDERLEISVIHNPSENTDKIRDYLIQLFKLGKIKEWYEAKENCGSDSFLRLMEIKLDEIKSPFIVCTDGDIHIVNTTEATDVAMNILTYCPEVFCITTDISLENLPKKTFPECESWVPPTGDSIKRLYYNAQGPHHFMMMRTKDLAPLLEWINRKNETWKDTVIGEYAKSREQIWARSFIYHRHLAWDLYQDLNHPYTRERLSNLNPWGSGRNVLFSRWSGIKEEK